MTPDPTDGDERGGSIDAERDGSIGDERGGLVEDERGGSIGDHSENPVVRDNVVPQTGRPTSLQPPEQLGWHGWVLVGLVFVSFLIIPLLILYIPEISGFLGTLGVSQRQAYLALPMIPAILLGVTAVWAAVRSQESSA